MTTNVIDLLAGKVATDSRWSCKGTNFVLYIDNVGFEKIAQLRGFAYTFAGDGNLIAVWKDWLAEGAPGGILAAPPPAVQTVNGPRSIALCITDMAANRLLLHRGCFGVQGMAYFAGSGGMTAKSCWQENHDATKAVNSAIGMDPYSGGNVKFLEFSSHQNNLNDNVSMKEVGKIISTKGTVMYAANQNSSRSMSVEEAKNTDAEVKKLTDALSVGARSASAPCEAMYTCWTDDEMASLRAALEISLHEKGKTSS